MFSAYVGFIRDHFFLLSTDSTYSHVPGDKGGPIFFLQDFFWRSFYVQIDVLQIVSHHMFNLRKIVQIDRIHFVYSNCIGSICTNAGICKISTKEKKINPL